MPVDAAHPVRRFAPDRTYTFSVGWRFAEVNHGRVNNAGFSSKIDYDSAATSPLFALLGDSCVEALMVPWDSTIQGVLSRSVAGHGRVYNFAASGAPLLRRYFVAEARARGYSVVDLEPIFIQQFQRDGRRFEFPADAHWNAHGHAVATEALRGTRAFETTFGF